jgi:alpha-L-fucosidase 2
VAANTNYRGADFAGLCRQHIDAAAKKGYKELRARHVADHRRLFERVTLDLGGSEAAQKPTDERLAAIQGGASDPQLSALFFQYGRYLLLAGSRENSPLPMNLQGIWNDNLAANMVWTCDFHLDINTQQNYWPSEVCNLSECGEPLFKLIESISQYGRSTAQNMYGAKGWVCHVYTNAWGFTAPGVGMQWGPFVTGGIWAASHLWEHYLFTRDQHFLRQRAYPVLKSAAEFFLDYMVEDPKHGWLVTGPSISPENVFLSPDGTRCSASMGPTCDRELVYGLFSSCIQASTDLNIDSEFRQRVLAARAKLPPLQIGKHGQLQEWLQDLDEGEPNHRHTSHLIALFPLDQISPEKTPDLAKAARVTIDRRTGQKNWEDVEWSRANLINFFARLRDGNAAHKHLVGLLREDTDVNMMTFSRAGIAGARENIFAIDGNTAGASGMAEMLLQSFAEIHLLPALPNEWTTGSVQGLRARGGFEVEIRWKAGVLSAATVRASQAGKCSVRYGDKVVALDLKAGEAARFDQNLTRARS